jgi:hypothetical protein
MKVHGLCYRLEMNNPDTTPDQAWQAPAVEEVAVVDDARAASVVT